MIMTKDKARELNTITKNRLGSNGDANPSDGLYMLSSVRGSDQVRKLAETASVDYFVMGMVIPAHKAAAVCRLLEDENGNLPSPLMMLKKSDDVSTPGVMRTTTLPASSDRTHFSTREEAMHDDPPIAIKNIEIIPGRHEVKVSGKPVVLTFSEFRILQTLAGKPGWVFSRDKIIHAVHGDDYNCTERAVDVQVTGLRKKLGPAGDFIETVRGVGYRFRE
ncbi:MAG TPA: winged helix-turn-helix domain-containing protein [Kiritimatiellia bacterium]|nr:winged helix-turn-helix domain-containing protein [Kiritimatiellia bacterium]